MLSKLLRTHSQSHPFRNIDRLKKRANIAILLPEGYNLGHVKMGIGNFAGLPEFNMERKNNSGIKYRDVMHNFLVEIERCLRLGIEFDLYWDTNQLNLEDYEEIVNVKENGEVHISKNGISQVLDRPRYPERPSGDKPELSVELVTQENEDLISVLATAYVKETTAPVYYTIGANKEGIYENHFVLWELYGPEEEDYTDFWNNRWDADLVESSNQKIAKLKFDISKPGIYRLKVSTADLEGRSNVVWEEIVFKK